MLENKEIVANATQSAEQAQQNGASANESTAKNGAEKKSTKKRKINPFWVKVNNARRAFEGLYQPSNLQKWNCLAKQIEKETDKQAALGEYREYVKKVLGRTIIHEECKEKGYDPEIFATHVVFLGSAKMHKVMENGISCIENPESFTEAFLPTTWEEGVKQLLEENK